MRLEGFSGPASDMYRIAVRIAGFDAGALMKEIHRRAPRRATIDTVCKAMQVLADRYDANREPKIVVDRGPSRAPES